MIKLMLKHLFLTLILLLPGALFGAMDDNWFDPAYLEANTLYAGTGFIDVPSPEVIPSGILSAAIHRYQIKVDYGFWDVLELGLTADLDGYNLTKDGDRNQLYYGRLRLLSSERFGLGLSLGFDGIGPEDMGLQSFGYIPKTALEGRQRIYLVSGAVLPFYQSMMITLGWVGQVGPPALLLNISKVVMPGMLAMAEYDGKGTNLGIRILVSPTTKLDLSFYHTQDMDTNQAFARVLDRNVRFGVTYSEPWQPPTWLGFKKKR